MSRCCVGLQCSAAMVFCSLFPYQSSRMADGNLNAHLLVPVQSQRHLVQLCRQCAHGYPGRRYPTPMRLHVGLWHVPNVQGMARSQGIARSKVQGVGRAHKLRRLRRLHCSTIVLVAYGFPSTRPSFSLCELIKMVHFTGSNSIAGPCGRCCSNNQPLHYCN